MEFYGFQIGDTPLLDVPQLAARYGTHVLVKDESRNPWSHTFKDRETAYTLLKDESKDGKIAYVGISSGNRAASQSAGCDAFYKATGKERLSVSIIDKRIAGKVKKALGKRGYVIGMDLSRGPMPNSMLACIARARLGTELDGYDIRLLEGVGRDGDCYASLTQELFSEGEPDFVFVPVGEGELMAKAIMSLPEGSRTKVIGITVPDNVFAHPGEDFPRVDLQCPADKLATPYSDYRDLLTRLCSEGGHDIIVTPYDKLNEEHAFLRSIGIRAEPSAAAAFAGARGYCMNHGLGMNDDTVVINTGFGPVQSSSKRRHSLLPYAAAVLLASIPVVQWGWGKYQEAQIKEYAAESYRKFQSEQLARSPIMNGIYAFALFRGGMREVDHNVLNDLMMWHVYNDNIARIIYAEGGRLRDNVIAFNEWRNAQKRAHDDGIRSAIEAISRGTYTGVPADSTR